MRKLFYLLLMTMGLALLTPAPVFAKDEEEEEEEISKKEKAKPSASLDRAFTVEIKALQEAETMLQTISDAKSAKNVKAKLMQRFSVLRPILGGTDAQLEELAIAQNRVSAIMWNLMKEPYFESENLQELWTVMTHHFARRAAKR